MGKRDYRWRESKKSKKEAKKPAPLILTPPTAVEVVRKRRHSTEEPERESPA